MADRIDNASAHPGAAAPAGVLLTTALEKARQIMRPAVEADDAGITPLGGDAVEQAEAHAELEVCALLAGLGADHAILRVIASALVNYAARLARYGEPQEAAMGVPF